MIHLEVVGVHIEDAQNLAVLWLQKVDDDSRVLEIFIGPIEAEAITMAQQGVIPPRPLTHNLLLDVLGSLGVSISEVQITNIENNTFYAQLLLSNGTKVSARPSDAIALAIRAEVPVLVTAEVFDIASKAIRADDTVEENPEEEIEAFRHFLEDLNPGDFDTQP